MILQATAVSLDQPLTLGGETRCSAAADLAFWPTFCIRPLKASSRFHFGFELGKAQGLGNVVPHLISVAREEYAHVPLTRSRIRPAIVSCPRITGKQVWFFRPVYFRRGFATNSQSASHRFDQFREKETSNGA